MFLFQTGNQKMKEVATTEDAIKKLVDLGMNKFDPDKKEEFKKGNVTSSDGKYYVRLDMDAARKNWNWINLYEMPKNKKIDYANEKKIAWFSPEENGKYDKAVDGEDKDVCSIMMLKIVTGFTPSKKKTDGTKKDGFTKEKKDDEKKGEKKEEKKEAKLFDLTKATERMYKFISNNAEALDYFDKEVVNEKDGKVIGFYAKFLDYFGATEETANVEHINDMLAELELGQGEDADLDPTGNFKKFKKFLEENVFAEPKEGAEKPKSNKYSFYLKGYKEGDISAYSEEPKKVADTRTFEERKGKKKETTTEDTKKEDTEKKDAPDEKKDTKKDEKKEETYTESLMYSYVKGLSKEDREEITGQDWIGSFWKTASDPAVTAALDGLGKDQKDVVAYYLHNMVVTQKASGKAKIVTEFYTNTEEDKVKSMIEQIAVAQDGWRNLKKEKFKDEGAIDYASLDKLMESTGVEWVKKYGPDAVREFQSVYQLSPERLKQVVKTFIADVDASDLLKTTPFDSKEQVITLLEYNLTDEEKSKKQ